MPFSTQPLAVRKDEMEVTHDTARAIPRRISLSSAIFLCTTISQFIHFVFRCFSGLFLWKFYGWLQ